MPLIDEDLICQLKQKSRAAASEYVFCSPEGKPYQPNNWRNRVYIPFTQDLIKAHPVIPMLSPHELRHTRATLGLAQRVSSFPAWVLTSLLYGLRISGGPASAADSKRKSVVFFSDNSEVNRANWKFLLQSTLFYIVHPFCSKYKPITWRSCSFNSDLCGFSIQRNRVMI